MRFSSWDFPWHISQKVSNHRCAELDYTVYMKLEVKCQSNVSTERSWWVKDESTWTVCWHEGESRWSGGYWSIRNSIWSLSSDSGWTVSWRVRDECGWNATGSKVLKNKDQFKCSVDIEQVKAVKRQMKTSFKVKLVLWKLMWQVWNWPTSLQRLPPPHLHLCHILYWITSTNFMNHHALPTCFTYCNTFLLSCKDHFK